MKPKPLSFSPSLLLSFKVEASFPEVLYSDCEQARDLS